MYLENRSYQIQGVRVLDIADQFGLPTYVYDADKIIQKIDLLRSSFTGVDLKIKYALKALSNLSILKLMRSQGVEVDVVSVNEARLAMRAGYEPSQIMYTPSGNRFAEIQEAIALGLTINADSLPLIEQIGQTYGSTVPICIRINPSIIDGGNLKIQTGHADSKFGIPNQYRPQIKALVEQYGIPVIGLHIHTGSDFKDGNTFLKIADVLFDLASDFPDLRFMDFGSGFKVAYREGDHATDLAELGQKVSAAFKEFCARYGRNIELWFEPGKLLVSESGHLLANVNVVKENPTRTFVQVDTGLNHLIRPMMYDAWHDIINVSNPEGPETLYTVVGYICETDTFATDRLLPQVRTNDVLSFENAGAYGFMMASTYNMRGRPAEVMVYDGQAYLIRERETFEDLLRGQIEIEFTELTTI
ncbi:diaminopimelate decarboxylase [Rudanella paleaurantiibacter]|uniref:Diaminopimelate decarboxylase n=1 Tax=Rudanella paleaurantiibacter TaxID=2614655 RepID=A0A7J5U086_9BACT|nr:diaminopimelate decarboxylase [Rudanella paleaurantiibacter]KAB7731110.1 diaminopimelate decarboxylase [Rudanella paleaurantiibacter]